MTNSMRSMQRSATSQSRELYQNFVHSAGLKRSVNPPHIITYSLLQTAGDAYIGAHLNRAI